MLLTLYRALIKTVLTYSSPVLLMVSPSAINQLDIIQRAGNTGWAAYSPDESFSSGRLPQFTPITLTKLISLLETLRWCRTHPTLHQKIVIYTDSMAAIRILQKHTPSTYPETAHQVCDEALHIKQLAIQIIFHWIPSHVGIFGNEGGRLANLATNLDTAQTCKQTIGTLGRQIPKKIKIMTDILYCDYYTTATGTWYLSTTMPEHRIHPNRCHSFSNSFKTSDKHTICNVCQCRFGPTHYLIECPGLPNI